MTESLAGGLDLRFGAAYLENLEGCGVAVSSPSGPSQGPSQGPLPGRTPGRTTGGPAAARGESSGRGAGSGRGGRFLPGLAREREGRALSQRGLEEITGVAQSTISALELEKRGANWATIRKLAAGLGAEPKDLMR